MEKTTEKEQQLFIFCFFTGTFINCCLLLNVISFFALFANDRYGEEHMSATLVSVLVVATEIGIVVSSPFYPFLATKVGRKDALTFGYIIMLVCNTICALVGDIPKENWILFSFLTFVFRFILGSADGFVQMMQMSICLQEMGEQRELVIGIINSAQGLGAIAGPIIGVFAYAYSGFQFALYLFSAALVLQVLSSIWFVPSSLNSVSEDNDDSFT